jgi:hypothetical protein
MNPTLAGVLQIIISEAGQRTREGQSQAKIADELFGLFRVVEKLFDELGSWLGVPVPLPEGARRRGCGVNGCR